ncbi:TPA: hypothetical protein L4E73_003315 [Pseudomonas aeruginosa]|nr:hypothetical protein [Pseudomonas aeruginosa]MBX6133553.1 hypothetical protein [Pseudomonas aeruginosa]MDI4088421.1 hypothetical protein [Pseudomonas aeruginosa]HBO1165271.1 hypothetical protein [Pseudomonas aeruginosa]
MADLLTKEHYELMAQFEREHSGRFDKEDKSLWRKGIVYQDGHINELFLAYRRGYAYGKAAYQTAEVYDIQSDLQNVIASRDGYRAERDALQAENERLRDENQHLRIESEGWYQRVLTVEAALRED